MILITKFITETGITPDERVQILESHNRLRSSVAQGRVPNQPGAENMREMVSITKNPTKVYVL